MKTPIVRFDPANGPLEDLAHFRRLQMSEAPPDELGTGAAAARSAWPGTSM